MRVYVCIHIICVRICRVRSMCARMCLCVSMCVCARVCVCGDSVCRVVSLGNQQQTMLHVSKSLLFMHSVCALPNLSKSFIFGLVSLGSVRMCLMGWGVGLEDRQSRIVC